MVTKKYTSLEGGYVASTYGNDGRFLERSKTRKSAQEGYLRAARGAKFGKVSHPQAVPSHYLLSLLDKIHKGIHSENDNTARKWVRLSVHKTPTIFNRILQPHIFSGACHNLDLQSLASVHCVLYVLYVLYTLTSHPLKPIIVVTHHSIRVTIPVGHSAVAVGVVGSKDCRPYFYGSKI
jgi:hypothetical protein